MSCQMTKSLGSYEIMKYLEGIKNSEINGLYPSLATLMKILLILAKSLQKQELNFSRSALFCMKNRVTRKYFVNDCHWKQIFLSVSPKNAETFF